MKPLLALLPIVLLAWFPALAVAQVAKPVGWYVMQGVHKTNVSDQAISDKRLTGFHLRDEWQLIEPQNETHRWVYFDGQIARAKRLGKHVTLGVYSGNNSPAWLGVPRVNSVPIPWDPKVTSAWADFVADLGQKYANEPIIDAVHISSPATNDSMEMHYPPGLTSVSGYSDQKVIDVWKKSIDAYVLAFPNKTLVLDISPVPNWNNPTVMRAAIAYLQAKTPNRSFIHCSLKDTTSPTAAHQKTIEDLGKAGEYVGFEFVGPSGNSRFVNFSKALQIAAPANPRWWQVYQGDIGKIP